MYKELVIVIIILILIFGLNYITEKNTEHAVDFMEIELNSLRQDLENKKNNEDLNKKADTVIEKWEELDDKLAFYIEHDELEKTKTALTSVKSYIEVEEYEQATERIDVCIYILEHIRNKETIMLDNLL